MPFTKINIPYLLVPFVDDYLDNLDDNDDKILQSYNKLIDKPNNIIGYYNNKLKILKILDNSFNNNNFINLINNFNTEILHNNESFIIFNILTIIEPLNIYIYTYI